MGILASGGIHTVAQMTDVQSVFSVASLRPPLYSHVMGFREDLSRRIDKKRTEIAALEDHLKTARTYLQAFEDMYKLASKDVSTSGSTSETGAEDPSFREGSMTGLAYEAIKKAGKAL